jgi:hypothetical protein
MLTCATAWGQLARLRFTAPGIANPICGEEEEDVRHPMHLHSQVLHLIAQMEAAAPELGRSAVVHLLHPGPCTIELVCPRVGAVRNSQRSRAACIPPPQCPPPGVGTPCLAVGSTCPPPPPPPTQAGVARAYKALLPLQAQLSIRLGDVKSSICLTPLAPQELSTILHTAAVRLLCRRGASAGGAAAAAQPHTHSPHHTPHPCIANPGECTARCTHMPSMKAACCTP